MCEVKEIRLFSNGSEEDRKAFDLLQKAKIPFANYGPTSEDPTPYIEYGFWRYQGLDGIKSLIFDWKNDTLPPPCIEK